MRLRHRFRQRPRARLLVVTAVEAEREAVMGGLGLGGDAMSQLAAGDWIVVKAAGVGPAAAAAGTARMLATAYLTHSPFDFVVCAGIGGGIAGRAEIGATVLAGRSVAADLGADSPDGFRSVDDLGFGSSTVDADPGLLESLRARLPDAVIGDVLTVSTVTGSAERAEALLARFPAAVAEAMEGFGVATAAAQANIGFGELRTISNVVGPRERETWRIPDALAALAGSAEALASLER